MRRFIADCALFVGVLLLPWWVVLILGSLFFIVFESYYELLFVGLLSDVLYAAPRMSFGGFEAMHVMVGIVLFVCLFFIKKRVRV